MQTRLLAAIIVLLIGLALTSSFAPSLAKVVRRRNDYTPTDFTVVKIMKEPYGTDATEVYYNANYNKLWTIHVYSEKSNYDKLVNSTYSRAYSKTDPYDVIDNYDFDEHDHFTIFFFTGGAMFVFVGLLCIIDIWLVLRRQN